MTAPRPRPVRALLAGSVMVAALLFGGHAGAQPATSGLASLVIQQSDLPSGYQPDTSGATYTSSTVCDQGYRLLIEADNATQGQAGPVQGANFAVSAIYALPPYEVDSRVLKAQSIREASEVVNHMSTRRYAQCFADASVTEGVVTDAGDEQESYGEQSTQFYYRAQDSSSGIFLADFVTVARVGSYVVVLEDAAVADSASTVADGIGQQTRNDLMHLLVSRLKSQTRAGTSGPGTGQGQQPSPAPPTGRIVVMGDSYASGEGTYNNGSDPAIPSVDYYPETATAQDHCHRSPNAYAPLLGVAKSDFVACSGATSDDIINGRSGEPPQLSVLSSNVKTVILSAGGDNVDFPTVLTDCTDVPVFSAHSYDDCKRQVDIARGKIPMTIEKLRSLYSLIESRTNGARLIVVGYPDLFPSGGHFGCNWIDEPRQKLLNDAGDDLDKQIKSAVAAVPNATFVDMRPWFTGHEVCGATWTPYINDLQTDMGLAHNCPSDYLVGPACSQSYHPDVPAYRAEAAVLQAVLRGGSPASPGPPAPATRTAYADCYDINFAGIDSQPMAHYCSDALSAAGFAATPHTDANGLTVMAASRHDAVYYASGHSGSNCPGEWNSSGTEIVDQNEATGASIIAPGDGSAPTYLAGPRDTGIGGDPNCFPGLGATGVLSSWASSSGIGHADLVVLQACETLKPTFTATDGSQLVSVGQQIFDAGAKVVVGFTDEVQFQGSYGQYGFDYGIPSLYRPTGDIWAHTFWTSLAAGVPVSYAVEDATAEETLYSGGDGYLSWRMLSQPDAPATLAQIQAGRS